MALAIDEARARSEPSMPVELERDDGEQQQAVWSAQVPDRCLEVAALEMYSAPVVPQT